MSEQTIKELLMAGDLMLMTVCGGHTIIILLYIHRCYKDLSEQIKKLEKRDE